MMSGLFRLGVVKVVTVVVGRGCWSSEYPDVVRRRKVLTSRASNQSEALFAALEIEVD